jgi:hypothetical protein
MQRETITEDDGADFARAVAEASRQGFTVWHLADWPTVGWHAILAKREGVGAGTFTERRKGATPAEAVRACLVQPGKTDDELLAAKVSKEISDAEVLRAAVNLKPPVVLRLLKALDDNESARAG